MSLSEIIAVVFSGLGLLISVLAILDSRKAVHIANKLNSELRGDVNVSVKNCIVAYLANTSLTFDVSCSLKYMKTYQVNFDLSVVSRMNVPTNIHGIELQLTFSNGSTKNVSDCIVATTPAKTRIDDPFTVNVLANGAYLSHYSVEMNKDVLWGKLDKNEAPAIEHVALAYFNDRGESKCISIVFDVQKALSDEEMQKKLNAKI